MQILTADRRFEERGANPYQPWGSTVPPLNSQIGNSVGGVVISDQTALQLAAVWGSVSIICDSLAAMPIRQYQATSMNTAVEIEPSPVVEEPWPEVTRRTYVTQGTLSLLLRGNLYGQIIGRDERLYPASVKLIHPDHAKRRRMPDGSIETRYSQVPIAPDDVTMAMGLALPEGIVGLNPIEHMRNTLGIARAQDLYAGAFFANSARPDGVIQVPGDLDPEEAKAMKLALLESNQGINKSHLPLVLTGGAEFKPISMNLADVQFLAQMEFSASTISGMIYRVPPHMIGMVTKDTSWGCLPGETQVLTTTGPRPLSEIEVGDEVWSLGDAGMEPKKVIAKWDSGVKPLLTFRTRGRVIRATANHHMVVRRWSKPGQGRKGRWDTLHLDASDIRVGDQFIVPHGFGDGARTMAPNGRELTPEAMEFAGLYTGDGCRGNARQIIIAHGQGRDGDHIDHYKASIAREFGVEPRTDKRGGQTRFSSAEAVEFLECGFTGTALTKRVPGWVFRIPRELQLAFLRGYLDSDGSVQHGVIVYSSAHRQLLEDVRHLCMMAGVPVGKVIVGRKAGPMTIDGRTYHAQIKWQLALSTVTANSAIGSNSPHKAERFIDTPTTRRLRYEDGWRPRNGGMPPVTEGWGRTGCTFHRVTRIEHSDVAVPVYDLTVADNHTLVADGVVIGQSGIEQQELGFVRNTLLNWLGAWEDLISSWLPPRQFVMFDLSQRLRGDTLQRWAAYQVARAIGAMNSAQIRQAEGLPPADPAYAAALEAYNQPFNSAPMPASPSQGGDKAN